MTHSPAPRPAELPRRRLLATGARAAAAVLAVAGAGGGRGVDGGANGSGRGDGRRRRTCAADLDARCAAIVPLMAGLDAFAAVSGRSAVLKDSLEIFLNATVKAVAA